MAKGRVAGFHNTTGQVLSEGNVYNFNINIVQGSIENQEEIEFELDDNGNLKVIYGTGATKQIIKKKKQESKNTSSKILLTEEK